eukprot:gene19315-13967_t
MSKYRNHLPHLDGQMVLTDGGLETTLVFHEKMDLPYFAAFPLLQTAEGTAVLEKYYRSYTALALQNRSGFIFETATWRASRDWATALGIDQSTLRALNLQAVKLVADLRDELEQSGQPFIVSGNFGPRRDGYSAAIRMTVAEAFDYHREQMETFAGSQADMVAAFTMTHVEEAIGITQAAAAFNMPIAISFTVETDGRLPSGDALEDSICRTDLESGAYPLYYMINCAHPSHFMNVIESGADWTKRIRGIRANASKKSHAELDESTELDAGDVQELENSYCSLGELLPGLCVVGGCCGTDVRHIAAMGQALFAR